MSRALVTACAFPLLLAIAITSFGNDSPPPSSPKSSSPKLRTGGELKCNDLRVTAGAVINDTRVVLVGTRDGGEDADPDKLEPNGAVIDLVKKKSSVFTNGHVARVNSITVNRGRVITASNNADPSLRIWDLKSDKAQSSIELDKIEDKLVHYSVAAFHKSDRVAVAADAQLFLYDLKNSAERSELTVSDKRVTWLEQPVVSADDEWIACPTGRCDLVAWPLKTKKAIVLSLNPVNTDPHDWLVHSICFGPKGVLYAARTGDSPEAAEKKDEKMVGAEKRGIVRVDLEKGQVTPLAMGHTIHTLSCAVDPSGKWLITVGTARSDEEAKRDITVGEIRLYDLTKSNLVQRIQLGDLIPMWVAFTPHGSVVCASQDGLIRWWSFDNK